MIELELSHKGGRGEFPFTFKLSKNPGCNLVVAFDHYSNMAFIIPPGVIFTYRFANGLGFRTVFPGSSRLEAIEFVLTKAKRFQPPGGLPVIPSDYPPA